MTQRCWMCEKEIAQGFIFCGEACYKRACKEAGE